MKIAREKGEPIEKLLEEFLEVEETETKKKALRLKAGALGEESADSSDLVIIEDDVVERHLLKDQELKINHDGDSLSAQMM